MKKTLILVSTLVLLFAACKKDPAKQYSTWYVNNDSFKTNDVHVTTGKVASILSNGSGANSFFLAFSLNYLPTFLTSFLITQRDTQDQSKVVLNFYYNGNFYIVAVTDGYINATSVNNKAQYTLPPTWFINYYNANDSVLIQGVFNEP